MSTLKEVSPVSGGSLHLPKTTATSASSSNKRPAWFKFAHRVTASFQIISLLLIGYLMLQNPFRSPAMEVSSKQELKLGENSYSLDFVLPEPGFPVGLLAIWSAVLIVVSFVSVFVFNNGPEWAGIFTRNDLLGMFAVALSLIVLITSLMNLRTAQEDPAVIMEKAVMSKLPAVKLIDREEGLYESSVGEEEPKRFTVETSLEHLQDDRYRFTVELPQEIFEEQNAELKKKSVEEKVYTVEESNR